MTCNDNPQKHVNSHFYRALAQYDHHVNILRSRHNTCHDMPSLGKKNHYNILASL